MRSFLALAMVATSSMAFADSDFRSGTYWLRVCEASKLNDRSPCLGLLIGAQDMHDLIFGDRKPALWCMPDNATFEQSRQVFVKYLRDKPEKLHWPGTILLYEAMRKAFPCAKN